VLVFCLRSFAAQSSRGIVRRGGIAAGGAAAGKGFFAAGIAAGGAAYRGEESAAMRAGFGVPPDFVAAVVAKKTGLCAHLRGLRRRFCRAVGGSGGGAGGRFFRRFGFGFGFGFGRFALIGDIKAGAFENDAGPAKDKPADFLAAFDAGFKRLLAHRLKNFKAVAAALTFIFVCWHDGYYSENNFKSKAISRTLNGAVVMVRLFPSCTGGLANNTGGSRAIGSFISAGGGMKLRARASIMVSARTWFALAN